MRHPVLSSSPHGRVPCLINRVNYSPSNLYWTDWNREAPKIETATVNGANRRVLVSKDIGLPNGLTFDPFSKLLCWADAGNFGDSSHTEEKAAVCAFYPLPLSLS